MLIDKLFRLGIPTYTTTIFSPIPETASLIFPIAKQLPTQIGRIYGMAIYADSVTPSNDSLITTTDCTNLYMTLKDGATNFFENVRLTDLLSEFSGTPSPRPNNFLAVNIPGGFDLSTSFYSNPTGLVAGAGNTTVALQLWYVSVPTYNTMLKSGTVGKNGVIPTGYPR